MLLKNWWKKDVCEIAKSWPNERSWAAAPCAWIMLNIWISKQVTIMKKKLTIVGSKWLENGWEFPLRQATWRPLDSNQVYYSSDHDGTGKFYKQEQSWSPRIWIHSWSQIKDMDFINTGAVVTSMVKMMSYFIFSTIHWKTIRTVWSWWKSFIWGIWCWHLEKDIVAVRGDSLWYSVELMAKKLRSSNETLLEHQTMILFLIHGGMREKFHEGHLESLRKTKKTFAIGKEISDHRTN